METRRVGLELQQRWLACPTLVLVLGAGCSSVFDNRPGPTSDAGAAPDGQAAKGQLEFPNQDLTDKHEAAKASPESFEPVIAYAKAVADFCRASLVDESCAPDCPQGPVKYKPVSELAPKHWVLTQDALTMLEAFKTGEGLPPAQFEQFVGVKSRLLGLAGHAAEEQALIENYAEAHPDAVAVVRRRLELLRQAGDVKAAEEQCNRSRKRMKSASATARLELLTSCVALHPTNAEGKTNPPDYARYLPNPTRAEQRLYRKHLIRRCVEEVGSKESRCKEACACKDPSADKQRKAKCKQTCRDCRIETAQRIRECKKTGGLPPTRAARPKRGVSAPTARPKSGAPAAAPRPKPDGPEPKSMEL